MPTHQVSATGIVHAPPQRVYGIIADYRHGHPHIVPRPPFDDIVVEKGGVGAGTELRFGMKVMGRMRTMRAIISEPEPGRVLTETDPDTGTATSFTAEPLDGGNSTQVTITTNINTWGGPLGWIECWIITRILQPIYSRELQLLAEFAEKKS